MSSHTQPQLTTPVALTEEAFAHFGQVIDIRNLVPQVINDGSAQRFDTAVSVDPGGGSAAISVFVGQPHHYPVRVATMERHPLGSQTFMPLDRRPYLVVVATNGPEGLPMAPRVFIASGEQGVSYPAGLWHHPLLALEEVSRFLVIDRQGPGNNLELADYPDAWEIVGPD
ncbi:MAG: ureidoglycolate lyase [Burkholderiaceae bacterium]